MNVGLLRNLYYNFKLTKSPWSQGVMVGAVTYGVKRPGFDPSNIQFFPDVMCQVLNGTGSNNCHYLSDVTNFLGLDFCRSWWGSKISECFQEEENNNIILVKASMGKHSMSERLETKKEPYK